MPGPSQTDEITATVEDDDEARASGTADATVSITNRPPTVVVEKAVSPATANVGDPVTFTFTVHNTSGEAVTLTALTRLRLWEPQRPGHVRDRWLDRRGRYLHLCVPGGRHRDRDRHRDGERGGQRTVDRLRHGQRDGHGA